MNAITGVERVAGYVRCDKRLLSTAFVLMRLEFIYYLVYSVTILVLVACLHRLLLYSRHFWA